MQYAIFYSEGVGGAVDWDYRAISQVMPSGMMLVLLVDNEGLAVWESPNSYAEEAKDFALRLAAKGMLRDE